MDERELDKICDGIETRQDLSHFINLLRQDIKSNDSNWDNRDLESFLEAMSAWVEDMDGYYSNMGIKFSEKPSWKMFADILMASRTYE